MRCYLLLTIIIDIITIILSIFASFTNFNFTFMEKILNHEDLDYCVSFTKHHLNQLKLYLEMNMDFVASDMEKASEDSVLFRNYNTCGYLLASIRDILKEFEADGK